MSFWLLLAAVASVSGQDCPCNLVASVCDEFCCCDTSCASITVDSVPIIKIWDRSKKCQDLIYGGSYNVPDCNRDYQKSAQDLYQGLRIAYNLFRNLGCVATKNSNANQKIEIVAADQATITAANGYFFQPQPVGIQEILQFSRNDFYIPRSAADKLCKPDKLTRNQAYPLRWCWYEQKAFTDINQIISSYEVTYYNNLEGFPVTITYDGILQLVFDSSAQEQFKIKAINGTIPTPSGSPAELENIVVGGYYRIVLSEGGTTVQAANFTPIILDSVLAKNNKFHIPRFMGVVYQSTNNSIYETTSAKGYERGTLVRFKRSDLNEIPQPMYIGLESFNGNCYSYNQNFSMAKPLEVRFLEDQKFVCSRQGVGFTDSSFAQAIPQNLIKAAQYADSDPKLSDEWISVAEGTGCQAIHNTLELQIIYQGFGQKGKEKYRIDQVKYQCSQNNPDQQTYVVILVFYEIPNKFEHYKAPAPQLIGGLPNVQLRIINRTYLLPLLFIENILIYQFMNQLFQVGLKRALPAILLNKCFFYFVYKITNNNECVVDVAYTVSHLVAGGVYAYHFGFSSQEAWIKLFILGFWTARLAGFLLVNRIFKGFHDPRYEAIFKKYDKNSLKKDAAVFAQFMFQGLIVLVTSLPLYFLFKNNALALPQYFFLGTALLGAIGEGIADHQLEEFKKTKQTNQIMERGLWKKSRHPNLFFDLVTWTSLAFAAIRQPSDAVALIGPVSLYLVMDKLTTPITERLMKKKRGDAFVEYQKRTNKFFPF